MHTARSTSTLAALALLVLLALAAPSGAAASTPTAQATSAYAPDRVLVRFREAPSDTDLEMFSARQFMTLVETPDLDEEPGHGWYVFRIDDGMDASLVRELLRRDALVCNVELLAPGGSGSEAILGAAAAAPCVPTGATAGPMELPGGDAPEQAGPGIVDGAGSPGAPLLAIGGLGLVGLLAWAGRRARRMR